MSIYLGKLSRLVPDVSGGSSTFCVTRVSRDVLACDGVGMIATRRTNRLDGASVAALVEWQARTFPTMALRPTPFDDELPDDLFADVVATRAAIARAQRAG
jgi:hypothetical protein